MASRLSKVYDINMPADRSEYSYPITNITYHLPESPHPERGEAAAQKAFQRILDSYDENERLADAFQVELDKRTQIANERKAEERRIRVERQRLAREEKRNKKLGKNHKAVTTGVSSTPTTATTTPPPGGLPTTAVTSHLSVQALAQAFQPRHGRFAAAGYSLVGLERRPSIDHAIAASRSSGRSRQSSVGSLHSCSSGTNTTIATSAHEGTEPSGAPMVDSRLSFSASDHPHPPHSPPLFDVHGHHSSHSSHPPDRSLSSSPILPLTPSPRLNPSSDTAFGVVAPFPSTLAATTITSTTTVFPTSSTMTSSASGHSPSSFTSPCTNNNSNTSLPTPPPQKQQHSGSSTLPMRNKRKQAIPVHPSVIKRIPGITFRIQPDLDKHLQVEILKNIEDYQSTTTKNVPLGGGHTAVVHTSMDKQQEEDASQLQASQDLSKVRQSITSSRPGYASLCIPDDAASYDDPYLQDYRETSPQTLTLHAAPNNNNVNTTRYHPYQRHSRNGSLGSGHNVSLHTPTKLRSRSSSSANIWAPYAPSATGLAMLLSDVVAARATLPLSWDNFSTRDCQVNKVVGKNGRDFEQLEAVVQETVARHQAVAAAAQQEADEEIQEDGEAAGVAHKSDQKSLTAAAAKESSEPSGDAFRKRKTAPVTTPPPPAAAAPPSQASAQRLTGSRATRSRTTHQAEGGRPSRAGATDLVEGYDDIERILKEKRQKKREQQKRRDSQSRGVSEATTEGDYDLDVDMEHPRIKEDVDMDDRSALLRGYTESETESSNSTTPSKRVAAKPPSPPHSRQVTPAAKVDLSSSSLQHHTHLGASSSRTPPTTPTRASARNPQHTDPTHQDTGAESAVTTPVSKTRARAKSFSTTIPTDANTNFFESALEMIEAKRRQSIAKKKASAVVHSATNTDSPQDHQQKQQVDEQQQQANRQLEQELANETSQKMMAPNSNIPKSSKLLPGRVLRKPRVRNYDGSDVETDHQDGGSTSASAAASTSTEVTYDRDCSSCRLDVTDMDRELWKQARQSGEINLNPKTWGRTAILCSSCRTQYRRHGLRCTQCFYVPVWNPEPITPAPATDEASSSAPTPARLASTVSSLSAMPKPGGTCKRCKAGTWFKEV